MGADKVFLSAHLVGVGPLFGVSHVGLEGSLL